MVGYWSRFAIAAALVAAVAACSGSNSMSPSGSGSFSWSMDGTNYSVGANYIQVTATSTVPGSVLITGTQVGVSSITGTKVAGTGTASVSLELGYIPGPGTYPLGVNQLTNAGGTAIVETTSGAAVGNWSTGFSGAAGTVTISSISSSQIVGTFQFTAPPQIGSSGASKVVTNGKFTVPASGFAVAPAATPGSFLNATIAGQAFVSATESGQGSANSFGLLGSSTSPSNVVTSISIVSTGNITPGSYPVSPPQGGGNYFNVTVTFGGSSYGGLGADTGTVTITSNSGGRIKGTVSGNFGGLSVTNGSFDIKLN
jgi:hypothetical protein